MKIKQRKRDYTSIKLMLILPFIVLIIYIIVLNTQIFKEYLDNVSLNKNVIIKEETTEVETDLSSYLEEIENLPLYVIDASLNEQNGTIYGKMELTLDNPRTANFLFYTYTNEWLPMIVKKVLVDNITTTFEYDKKQIKFQNLSDKSTTTIQIEFETRVPNKGTRFGVKDNVWLLTTWYPILGILDENDEWKHRPDPQGMGDPFYFDFADYDVTLLTNSTIKWLSSGRIESEEVSYNSKKSRWKVEQVRNFALVGSSNFYIETFPLNDKTSVSIAVTDKQNMNKVKKIASSALPLFTEMYGELPYSQISVVETANDTNFALEYPNLAIFSKDMYVNDRIEHWIPHEVAHLWWYNAVGVVEPEMGWIDEGLAEQSVVWYLEKQFSVQKAQTLRHKYRDQNKSLISLHPNRTMSIHLDQFSNYNEFKKSWYSRSADMFLLLEETIGKENYIAFMKELYKQNIGKTIDLENIEIALYTVLGEKTSFIINWVNEAYKNTKWEVIFE